MNPYSKQDDARELRFRDRFIKGFWMAVFAGAGIALILVIIGLMTALKLAGVKSLEP